MWRLWMAILVGVLQAGCGGQSSDEPSPEPTPAGGEWPSWPPPPDLPPSAQYTAVGDAAARMITDSATGLTWSEESSAMYSWADALAYCHALSRGDFHDWRLPNAIELLSIVNFGTHDPAIDTRVFGATTNDWAWSSTPYAYLSGQSAPWAVWFRAGMTTSYGEGSVGTAYYTKIRCVRGPLGATSGPRYLVADGTVYDPVSKLTWQQEIPSLQVDSAGASVYCGGLSLAGASWRRPTVKELETLVDRSSPAGWLRTTTVFQVSPGIRSVFWSATPDVSTRGLNQWRVGDEGSVMPSAVANLNSVICVH